MKSKPFVLFVIILLINSTSAVAVTSQSSSTTIGDSGEGLNNLNFPRDTGFTIIESQNQDISLEERWNKTIGERNLGSDPVVNNGTVYYGVLNETSNGQRIGEFYAINTTTGEVEWKTEYKNTDRSPEIYTTPAIADGKVYFGTEGGTLYGLDIIDGSVEIKRSGSPIYALTVHNHTLYYAETEELGSQTDDPTTVYALNTANGATKWEYDTYRDSFGQSLLRVYSAPTVVNGTVYLGGVSDSLQQRNGYVIAIDADTGVKKWRVKLSASDISSPAVAQTPDGERRIIVGVTNRIIALNQTGSVEWRERTNLNLEPYGIVSHYGYKPVITDQRVIAKNESTLRAFSLGDGAVSWETTIRSSDRDNPLSSPVVGNGRIYAAVDDASSFRATIYGIDSDTGEIQAKGELGREDDIATTPSVTESSIYVSTYGGNTAKLYAFDQLHTVSLNLSTNTSSITTGQPVRFIVTRSDTNERVNATVTIGNTTYQTGPDGSLNRTFNSTGYFSISVDKNNTSSRNFQMFNTTIAVNTTFVDVSARELSGSGTGSDPYKISNASELQAMEDDPSANYILTSDIDASNTDQWNDGRGFDPIGGRIFSDTTPDPFQGSFDGNGHTISGLVINRPTEEYVGLFGVNNGGVIKNTSVVGLNISGSENTGGLVGFNYDGGTIATSTASGNVSGTRDIGGLVGDTGSDSVIENASASATVAGGADAGGLAGTNVGTVRDAFAVGSVSGSNTGGLIGDNRGDVADSYWDENATGQSTSGGGATGLTTTQMQGSAAASNMSALDFKIVWVTQPNDYPALAWQTDRSEDESSETDDTTPPKVSDPTAMGVTGNGIVVDGEEVTVAANVTDTGSGVESVVANASAFGTDFVALTDDKGDGRYTGTFSVNESATATTDTAYEIPINATDKAGNVNDSIAAGPLEVDALDTTVFFDPASQQLTSNTTATFDIVVNNGTNGVGAWELTINQTGSDVANITSVTLYGDPGQQTVSIASDNNSVYADAALADTNDTGNVTIATVTVVSDGSGGNAVFGLDVASLGTEAGFNYDVTDISNASLSITETTPPEVSDVTTAEVGDDGVVVDGEQVTVAATVNDGQSGVENVTMNASTFGAGLITLSDDDGDGRYDGTFTVNGSAAAHPGEEYQIQITATDQSGNTNRTTTDPLELKSPETAVSIVPSRQQIATGNTTTLDIVVANATNGVDAWNLSVTLSDPGTADIQNATLSGEANNQTVSITPENDSVSIEAEGADIADEGTVTIASLTVAGSDIGSTALTLDVTSLETETGADYNTTESTEGRLSITPPLVRPAYAGPPTDPDGDGQFEDINGNGNFTIVDVQAFYASRNTQTIQAYPARYNYNNIGNVDIVDVQRLYFKLQQREQTEEE